MKVARLLLYFAGSIAFVIAATALWLYLGGARRTADFIGQTVLGHVFEPADYELPVTIVNYPSSPSTIAAMGGRGAGLDCSIPWYAMRVFSRAATAAPVTLQFRQACAFHDLCYRHGLATYGYMQADCDYLLQEQAFRICRNLSSKGIDECRGSAKKVVMGVRAGGFNSFHDWDTSTYLEFDPMPKRSQSFIAHRLVLKDDRKAEAPQDILRFDIERSSVRADCLTCTDHTAAYVPGANADFLPMGTFAAPQLISQAGHGARLLWLTRTNEANTHMRINTMIWRDQAPAFQKFSPSTDLAASSPIAIFDPEGGGHSAISLSNQKGDGDCSSALVFRIAQRTSEGGRCIPLPDFLQPTAPNKSRDTYRLFQHPLVADQETKSILLIKRGEDDLGASYRDKALVAVASFSSGAGGGVQTYPAQPISERDEPLAVLSQTGGAPRLLSLRARSKDGRPVDSPDAACGDIAHVAELQLSRESRPDWVEASVSKDGRRISGLSSEWIERPALLLRDSGATGARTLVLTRARALKRDSPDDGAVVMEAMKIARDPRDQGSWRLIASGALEVSYRKNPNARGQHVCAINHKERMMAALKLAGAQTLSGELDAAGKQAIVLVDPCLGKQPIILRESSDRLGVEGGSIEGAVLIRTVAARDFDLSAVGKPLDAARTCDR